MIGLSQDVGLRKGRTVLPLLRSRGSVKCKGIRRKSIGVTSSVLHGSGIGPIRWIIIDADLHPVSHVNDVFKYCIYTLIHGRRNVSKSGTARVEKRTPQVRESRRRGRWGLGKVCPLPSRLGSWGASWAPPAGSGRNSGGQHLLAYFRATECCW